MAQIESVGYPASCVIDRIRKNKRLAIYEGLRDMRYDDVPAAAQAGSLAPYAKEVAEYLRKSLAEYPDDPLVIDQASRLLSIGCKWQELAECINDNKFSFLRDLLKGVKEYIEKSHYSVRGLVLQDVQLYQSIGIDWPEFETIKKTMQGPIKESTNSNGFLKNAEQEFEKSADQPKCISKGVDNLKYFVDNGGSKELAVECATKYKAAIIKYILNQYKKGNIKDTKDEIMYLRLAGIRWPELEAIEKSMYSDQKRNNVNENEVYDDSESYLTNAQHFFKDDRSSIDTSVRWALDNLLSYKRSGGNIARAQEILHANKEKTIKGLLTTIRQQNFSRTDLLLDELHELKISWPELELIKRSVELHSKQEFVESMFSLPTDFLDYADKAFFQATQEHPSWIQDGMSTLKYFVDNNGDRTAAIECANKYKPIIIKYMLWHYKKGNQKITTDLLDGLKYVGVTWPELAAIERSLRSDKKIQENIEDDQINADFLKHSVKKALQRGDIKSAVGVTRGHLAFYGDHAWVKANIAPMLKRNLAKIYKWMDSQAEQLYLSHVTGAYETLTQLGIQCPEAQEIIEKHKRAILTNILQRIKRDHNYEHAHRYIETLRDIGINWREFDAIEKSATAHQIKESDTEFGPHVKKHILWLVGDKSWAEIINWLQRNEINLSRIPELEQKLMSYKDEILKSLLWSVKHYTSKNKDIEKLLKVVLSYKKIGLEWPELDTIEKSLNAMLSKLNEQAHGDDYVGYDDLYDEAVQALESKDQGWTRAGVENLSMYVTSGGNQQLAIQLADKFKDKIMQNVLFAIKNGFLPYAEVMLNCLGYIGVEWPELKIIQKSQEAGWSKN